MAIMQRKRSEGLPTAGIATNDFQPKSYSSASFHSPSPPTSSIPTSPKRQNDWSVQIGSPDYSRYSTDVVNSPKLRRRPTYTFEKTEKVHAIVWKTIYATILFMWITGYRNYNSQIYMYEDFLDLVENNDREFAKSQKNLETLEEQLKVLETRQENLAYMNHAFLHEVRMIEEMAAEDVDMHITGAKMAESSTMSRWIVQREEGLKHRTQLLKSHIQEQSKKTVLEKYGPGPYYVKFNVNVLFGSSPATHDFSVAHAVSSFMVARGTRVTKHFTIELAPLDLMPHSIHLFLELVESGLWNDSVFLHNDSTEHIMIGAPLDYQTHELKSDQLDELEFRTLGFPEYSPKYQHELYSVGFGFLGPTIYINTLDNTNHHGPGSQDHHELSDDADPCFGKVIQGHNVIHTLLEIGTNGSNRLNPKKEHPWQGQDDMFFTRIVSAEILKR